MWNGVETALCRAPTLLVDKRKDNMEFSTVDSGCCLLVLV